MKYEWGNHLENSPIKNIKKTVQIKVKLPHVNKKNTSEEANFCSNTNFSI